MPTLTDKLVSLERTVAIGEKALEFWKRQIETHGEKHAEAFYLHLGLNHIEKKSFEYDGMMLSREPTEIEKLCFKSIAQAQDTGKESVRTILLDLRASQIDSGLSAIKKLDPSTYHELVLTVPNRLTVELRTQVGSIFMKGKRLVDAELAKQGKSEKQSQPDAEDDSELDDLTDLTTSRVTNDVQGRITAATQRFTLLGLTGAALWDAVDNAVRNGSTGYIDRAATGLANRTLNFGREREAEDRSDDWERVEYSALLDQNVCEPCAADDGETAANEDDLTPAPNPDCQGGDWCRCFHVFIAN